MNPFLSGVLCLIEVPFRGLIDRFLGDLDLLGVLDLLGLRDLLGDLDLLDPLNDLDLSLGRNRWDGDLDPRLRGEDLGDRGRLDPEEFNEVLS